MNAGRSLSSLAAELERQHTTRKDYLAPQDKLNAIVVHGTHTKDYDDPARKSIVKIEGLNGEPYELTQFAHRQVAAHLDIPRAYYERMQEERPELLATNINTWLRANGREMRTVRTLDGKIRAFMSEKYRPLDNFELAEAILPKLIELNVKVTSCELTEKRMYIKGILPDLCDDLPVGAIWGSGSTNIAEFADNKAGKLCAAIVISNSEIGAGSLRIEPSVFTSWCTNMAVIAQAAMRKYHVGRSFEAQEDFSIYRDETRLANDKAFWLKVRDVAAAAFDKRIFEAAVAQIREASGQRIMSEDLPAVVKSVVKLLALPEKTTTGILTMLARGGDLSKWGLSSAVTALANTTADYELTTELERAGGEVLALVPREWGRVSNAVSAA